MTDPTQLPFDVILEILRHIAVQDPAQLVNLKCLSRAIYQGLHAIEETIYQEALYRRRNLPASHCRLLSEHFPAYSNVTWKQIFNKYQNIDNNFEAKDASQVFIDARRLILGGDRSQPAYYRASPGEVIQCSCERAIWTSEAQPYVIYQVWLAVGSAVQAGLYNGTARGPGSSKYQELVFRLRAPHEAGVYPVSLGWAMHFTYLHAVEGWTPGDEVLGWIEVSGSSAKDSTSHSSPALADFNEAIPAPFLHLDVPSGMNWSPADAAAFRLNSAEES